jgi:hypothetical protein
MKDISFAVGTADPNDVKATYRALQIDVDPTTFTSIGLRWTSQFVEEQFFSRMTQMSLDNISKYILFDKGTL